MIKYVIVRVIVTVFGVILFNKSIKKKNDMINFFVVFSFLVVSLQADW